MFLRILYKSFAKALKEKLLLVLTVAFGASLASAMFNVALDVGDRMNQELKAYGANLTVVPKMDTIPVEADGVRLNPLGKQAYLREDDLAKLKTIFWANNILDFAPYLETEGKINGSQAAVAVVGTWFAEDIRLADGSTLTTGVSSLKPWWTVSGRWPKGGGEAPEALVGRKAAERLHIAPGDRFELQVQPGAAEQGHRSYSLQAVGVLDAGGTEDEAVYVPLALVQEMLALPGKFARAEVSALTVPDTDLAKRAGKNPSSLREREFDEWYCTAFAGAIAYQIEESIPGSQAKPIRQIADSEGAILKKIRLMMIVISFAAVLSSALGISSLMNNKVQERRKEIALMKALGGNDRAVMALFLAEAAVGGLLGGCAGYGLGLVFAQIVGHSVFGAELAVKWLGLPLVLLLSLLITVAGSYPALRSIVKLEPVQALYGR